MPKPANKIAVCGMMTALGVVVMLIGHWMGFGVYAAPMMVGLALVPLGEQYGKRYHALMWLAISILSALMGVNVEQTLFFALFFGLYPLLRPFFMRLPKLLCLLAKLLYFNAVAVGIELLILLVIAPEAVAAWLLWILLILGNLMFFGYDFIVPRADILIRKLKMRFGRGNR